MVPPKVSLASSGLARLPFLACAGVAFLAGLDAALMLLGVWAPVRIDRLPDLHGMLLVLGFVGTLIALERAVALRRRLGFLAPGLLGLGALLVLTPLPIRIGQTALAAGAIGLLAVYVPLWRRQRDDAVLVQAMGAAAAAGAAVLWLGGTAVPALLPWLVGFVVLTIGGERLELARLAMGPSAGTAVLLMAHAVFAGLVAALLWPVVGSVLLGLALLLLTGWLAVHDVARATIRSTGLPRFAAGCMLAGYAWLGVAGAIWLVGGEAVDGARYDAIIHAVFLGFTMSMIMAHAPVILPAVLRRPLPYDPVMFAPVVLLHAGLVLRLWIGDALGNHWALVAGGVLNVVALLGFVAVSIWSATRPVNQVVGEREVARGAC